ncbi:MAG TPA: phosphodiester glycosidase family protein [Candidatus Aphodomonas merdavium]|nr:phosphodiester glycosidase family protein [Candidatus Aphodomonas merdavium]
MAGKKNKRDARAWLFLCALVLLFPLLLTATTTNPMRLPMEAESTIIPQATANEIAITATPAPSLDTGSAASGDTFSDVFVDVTEGAQPLSTAPPSTPAPAVTLANPDHMEYTNSSISITIDRCHQDDFVYFAADIRLTDITQFSYAFANEKFGSSTEALSDIAERHNPLLAINGDFCGFHQNGIIIRGGELFRKQNSARALLIVDRDGSFRVLTDRSEKQGLVANRLMEEGVWHTFEFGPVLVENGEAIPLHSSILRVDEGYLEPRTAIGQFTDDPLHYLVIVVDGRREGYSEGCDLPTLQQLFLDYGVETAFNLDGGGSTTLYFNGEIINKPAAGEERRVSDIIMFMR